MKTSIFIIAVIALIIMIRCGGSHTPAPIILYLVRVDSEGHNLITSVNTPIAVTYSDQGITKTLPYYIGKLMKSASDTAAASRYNGLHLQLSAMLNSNITYNLCINGKSCGTFYFTDYKNLNQNLFFNRLAVKTDSTVMPFVAVFQEKK
jgi:hypothetical protein